MLDKLIGGYGHGHGHGHMYGHKDHRSSGFGFQEHKEFVSREESQGGHFDRHMRLPVNHGRPPMTHMSACDEDDSDSDVENSRHHINNHHQQPHHSMAQPHHNGKMGNGWQGGHGMQHHGGHEMQHHGGHGMQHHGGHEMQNRGGYGMQHQGGHGKMHHDKFMACHVPPHHVFMNPDHTVRGHAVVVKENRRVSNNSGSDHKARWGNQEV